MALDITRLKEGDEIILIDSYTKNSIPVKIEKIGRKVVTFSYDRWKRYNIETKLVEKKILTKWEYSNFTAWNSMKDYEEVVEFKNRRKFCENNLDKLSREEINKLYVYLRSKTETNA